MLNVLFKVILGMLYLSHVCPQLDWEIKELHVQRKSGWDRLPAVVNESAISAERQAI